MGETSGSRSSQPSVSNETLCFRPTGAGLPTNRPKPRPGNTRSTSRHFPTRAPASVVSNGGGNQPTWSPDGTELFYRQGVCEAGMDRECESQMVSVAINAGPPFTPGAPEVLFADSVLHGTCTQLRRRIQRAFSDGQDPGAARAAAGCRAGLVGRAEGEGTDPVTRCPSSGGRKCGASDCFWPPPSRRSAY